MKCISKARFRLINCLASVSSDRSVQLVFKVVLAFLLFLQIPLTTKRKESLMHSLSDWRVEATQITRANFFFILLKQYETTWTSGITNKLIVREKNAQEKKERSHYTFAHESILCYIQLVFFFTTYIIACKVWRWTSERRKKEENEKNWRTEREREKELRRQHSTHGIWSDDNVVSKPWLHNLDSKKALYPLEFVLRFIC